MPSSTSLKPSHVPAIVARPCFLRITPDVAGLPNRLMRRLEQTIYLPTTIFVHTITSMNEDDPWDTTKHRKNLLKHGLDFKNAVYVLESPLRLDLDVIRNNEQRTQSFAYVFDYLAVLTVVHIGNGKRIISFRRASRAEREVYHEWLEHDFE